MLAGIYPYGKLDELGKYFNSDTFTQEEKENAESKLDAILQDLSSLKAGQQVIFEDLNELRELYYLDNKNWA